MELIKITSLSSALAQHSSLSDIDLSPCCASLQPMSQQRADAAGTDFMHVMSVHIPDLCIHRRATVKKTFMNKSSFWLRELVELQLREY